MAWLLFAEPITPGDVAGIALTAVGVSLVVRGDALTRTRTFQRSDSARRCSSGFHGSPRKRSTRKSISRRTRRGVSGRQGASQWMSASGIA